MRSLPCVTHHQAEASIAWSNITLGNRTFVIMLAACLLQILVVAGTVTYVAARDSAAASAPAAEADEPDASEAVEDEPTEPGSKYFGGYGY